MTAPTHDTEAGYSVEQVHRLQPGMIRHSDGIPLCYSPRMGLYREPRRPVPWMLAFLIVSGLCLAARIVL